MGFGKALVTIPLDNVGMLMLKKSLWIAVLIPLSMILYEYSVHLLSALTHYLCPPSTLGWYLGISFGTIGFLGLTLDPLILMFILVVAIAGAIRILAIATLAAILPILLVLSLIPKIGSIVERLIEALIDLVLVQLVAGAMIATASAIAGGITGSNLEDGVVKLMIAIATPRHLDALTGLWRTLEWLYSETGIAYGLNKPMLIIKDERVSLGGLPSYLTRYGNAPMIEFNPYKLNELQAKLATIMPGFREWIETKRRQEFFEALKRLVMLGLAIVGAIHIMPGIVGALIGHSKK